MNKIWKGVFIVLLIVIVVSCLFAVNFSLSLSATRDELATTQADLTSVQQQLTVKTEELNTTVVELNNAKSDLNNTKNVLNTTVTELNVTKTQLSAKETELSSTKDQLAGAKTQLQTANNEKTEILNSYSNIIDKINVRFGQNQQDRKSFITPSDSTLVSKVQEITGGYSEEVRERYDDYERLYRWIVNNISYSSDSYLPYLSSSLSETFDWINEFWRTPSETLKDKTGDCEDMALLLASMMKNYNQGKYIVYLITIRSASSDTGHMAVAYPVQGGKVAILDPAGKYYTGVLQSSWLYSEMVGVEINNWLSHWSSKMPNAYVDSIFSDSVDKKFSTTSEFLDWFNQQ